MFLLIWAVNGKVHGLLFLVRGAHAARVRVLAARQTILLNGVLQPEEEFGANKKFATASRCREHASRVRSPEFGLRATRESLLHNPMAWEIGAPRRFFVLGERMSHALTKNVIPEYAHED